LDVYFPTFQTIVMLYLQSLQSLKTLETTQITANVHTPEEIKFYYYFLINSYLAFYYNIYF